MNHALSLLAEERYSKMTWAYHAAFDERAAKQGSAWLANAPSASGCGTAERAYYNAGRNDPQISQIGNTDTLSTSARHRPPTANHHALLIQ